MSSLPPPPPSGGPPPPPPPPPGYQPAPGQGYQPYPATYDARTGSDQYAGFGARLGGLIIDGLVTALIALPFIAGGIGSIAYAVKDCTTIDNGSNTTLSCDGGQAKGGFIALGIGLLLVGALIGIIVYCRKQGRTGQTWGAKALGFKVVDQNTGQPIGAWRAFGRQLARIVSGAVFYLGYLWMLWDPKKQTWHDKIVGTVVVKT